MSFSSLLLWSLLHPPYFGVKEGKSKSEGVRTRLILDDCSASSLGMMSEEEKKMQRIEDIKELLS